MLGFGPQPHKCQLKDISHCWRGFQPRFYWLGLTISGLQSPPTRENTAFFLKLTPMGFGPQPIGVNLRRHLRFGECFSTLIVIETVPYLVP